MVVSRAELSDRQQRMLEFIQSFTRSHGYPPTVREIGQAVGISSTSVVDYNLKILRKLGYLRRDKEVSRGIGLLVTDDEEERPSNVVSVPIVGLIAAGQPIEAYSTPDDRIDLGRDVAEDGAFALRVKGKSMIEDLIDDGDLVVVRPQVTAENGDIVVALLTDSPSGEGQATLKRLYREKSRIRLQPANSEMSPIYVSPEEIRIQGKVTAVIRKL